MIGLLAARNRIARQRLLTGHAEPGAALPVSIPASVSVSISISIPVPLSVQIAPWIAQQPCHIGHEQPLLTGSHSAVLRVAGDNHVHPGPVRAALALDERPVNIA